MRTFLMILTALVLATNAQASEPNRTERTAIVGGISAPAGATTTTNFGSTAASYQERLGSIQSPGAGGPGGGDSGAGASSGAGSSSGSAGK